MAPKKQQTSFNTFIEQQEEQYNLTEQSSNQDQEKQSKQAFGQSVQQRISNLQQELNQHRYKIETLDELQQRINYGFSVVEQTINSIQQQMGDKLNQVTQLFQDISQFFQSNLQIFHQQIQQLQEQQKQQLEFNKHFIVQTQSITMDIEPYTDLQFVNRINRQIRRPRC